MQAITITHLARSPGSYEVSGPVGLRGRQYTATCRDAGDAAAKAVHYSKNNITETYVILGPKAVMDMIPVELRSGR